jgi:hypothetical protein
MHPVPNWVQRPSAVAAYLLAPGHKGEP